MYDFNKYLYDTNQFKNVKNFNIVLLIYNTVNSSIINRRKI